MILHYKCDRLNLARGLIAPLIFLSPYVFGLFSGYEVLTVLVLWLLLSDINHILHLHVHHPFTTKKSLNWLLDICMGVSTGMTASVWRIQHVHGHHRHYLSAVKNQSRKNKWAPGTKWETKRYSILGALSYSTWTIFPVFYHSLVASYKKGVSQNIKHPVNYRYAFVEQMAIVIFVLTMFVIAPKLTLFYLLPWYFLTQFVTRYIDYLNHVGCSHNIYDSSNNSVNYWYET